MSFLMDTNVLSEVRKGEEANRAVKDWWDSIDITQLYLSVMVAGEICLGIDRLMSKDPIRARKYQAWLSSVIQAFEGRILSVDMETAEIWGRLASKRSLPVVDSLLAATALTHDMTLVTRNTRDIHDTGVRYLNPFEQ